MANFIIGVISGIVTSILTAVGIWFYRRVEAWYRFRPFHRIWKPFSLSSTMVVLTGKKSGHTIKVSVSETDASESIRKLLAANKNVSQLVSGRDPINMDNNNVIALGSERTNAITSTLMKTLAGVLNYSYTADNDLIVNGELFKSLYDHNVLVKDYALVCKATNPRSDCHKFLVVAGNHGIGTQGAVLAITSRKQASDIIRQVGSSDFYAVIETEMDEKFGKYPVNVTVKRCGFIPQSNTPKIETITETREVRLDNFIKNQGVDDKYFQHVRQRARLGIRIGNVFQANGVDVDMDAIYFGAMLHDIGRCKSSGIDHGILGAELVRSNRRVFTEEFALMPDTFAKICEAIECHVVGGIRKEWIQGANLNLPLEDYLPQSLEAKIVAFCDQVLHDRNKSIVLKEAPKYDMEVRKQFYDLTCDIMLALFPGNELPYEEVSVKTPDK